MDRFVAIGLLIIIGLGVLVASVVTTEGVVVVALIELMAIALIIRFYCIRYPCPPWRTK